mgnify:FL=1
MDLLEIDAASNTGVDNIRDAIIDKVNMAPAEGRYRVTIIDEVHMLSTSAFNALLKTLEEPPKHAIFILATTDVHKVPATILSRCQRFDFRRVTPSDIAKRLLYVADCEGIKLHEDAAKLLARHADGALRDALTLLEQVSAFAPDEITAPDVRMVLGGVPQELIWGLIDGVIEQDAQTVLSLLEKAVDEGASFGQLAKDITAYARDLLLVSVGFSPEDSLSAREKNARLGHAQKMGRARLEGFIAAMRDAEKEMRQSSDHRLLLEITLVRACAGLVAAPVAAVAAIQPRAASAPAPEKAPQPAWRTPAATPKTDVIQLADAKSRVTEPKSEVAEPVTQVEEVVTNIEEAVTKVAAPKSEVVEVVTQVEEAVTNIGEHETQVAENDVEEAPKPKKSSGKGRRIATYDDLVELWPALLQRLRKKLGTTIIAYLNDARPAALSDDEITFEFTKEFHHAKALDVLKRQPFEERINEVLDKPRKSRFVLAAPKPKKQVVESAGDDEDDDEEFEQGDIIEFTQKIFAAEIVGRSGI